MTPISRQRHRRRNREEPLVNLTSMVDVLAVLMFFLLTMYSGGGYLTELPSGLTLPTSVTRTTLTRNVEISVLRDVILVDRQPIGDDLALFEEGDEMILPGLQSAMAAHAPADETTEVRVTILAHRATPFRLLKKIMYTLDQAGFSSQSLAVRQLT